MPGLDVLRGVAILGVLLDHGFASDQTPQLLHPTRFILGLQYVLRMGHMGVHLFFILSGFLITRILLESRTQPNYFHNFYTRRLLRIAPAYLLMLVALLATRSISARYLAVCLLCLCNMPGLLGATTEYPPLWSLSVEEQFYLVWPFAIHKLSLRAISLLCGALVLLIPAMRFALLYGPPIAHDIRFKTWAVADFFAAGALLAIAARLPHLRPLLKKLVLPLFLTGILLFTLQHVLPQSLHLGIINFNHAVYLEPWLLGFSALLLFAFLHPALAASAVFRPLIFLAKISYGLYLCHTFLFNLINRHWPLHDGRLGLLTQISLRFLAEASISIAIAALSRYTFEQFFLRLNPTHPPALPLTNVPAEIT
jgi:peptidoglycan/LPS O-acetylase OafA/YrhL